MNEWTPETIQWLQKPSNAVLVTVLLVVGVFALDYWTGERLDVSVLYFLPITLAAWALGRFPALITALVSGTSYYLDELHLLTIGEQSVSTSIANVAVRLLVFYVIAEVTIRLVKSRTRARTVAEELAKVNTDLQKTYASLDEDVTTAGLLQSTVLEVELPESAKQYVGVSLRFAGKTGGDFADAGRINGKVFVCVADISGKGTPAALFTALLKHLLTDAIESGRRGSDVVAAVNASLRGALPVDKFVTLSYAELDPATGILECVNAGHPEGLIYRAASGELERVTHTLPILGCFDMPESAESTRVQLLPGDAYVIYTDGAIESVGLDDNRLGEEPIVEMTRSYAHLNAQEMAEAIASGIEALIRPDRRDDLAVACLKCVG